MVKFRRYTSADEGLIKERTEKHAFSKLMEYDDRCRYLIMDDDETAGFFVFSPAEAKVQSSYIYIYVFAEHRRKGLATETYQMLENELRSLSSSWWTDYETSPGTDLFCLKMGFDYTAANCQLTYYGARITDDFSCIRQYRDSDFEIASSIWLNEYRNMHQQLGIQTDSSEPDMAELRSIYRKNSANTFVALNNNAVIGVGQLFEDYAGIGNLAVSGNHQRQGYGRKLLGYLVNKCLENDNPHPVLYCEPRNEKALRLYLNNGFKITKEESYAVKLKSNMS